jgi:hypothetical protein
MRSDTLAHLLSHSGACSGANMLVFESLVGLVVGSIAYRMRGERPTHPPTHRLLLLQQGRISSHTHPPSSPSATRKDLLSHVVHTGEGQLQAVYFGQQPHFDLVDRLNLTERDVRVIQVNLVLSCVANMDLILFAAGAKLPDFSSSRLCLRSGRVSGN